MLAAGPATGPALAVAQAFAAPGDPLAPRFGLFRGLDPADPFVASQRRNVAPGRQCAGVPRQRGPEVVRQLVNDAAGNVCAVRHADEDIAIERASEPPFLACTRARNGAEALPLWDGWRTPLPGGT